MSLSPQDGGLPYARTMAASRPPSSASGARLFHPVGRFVADFEIGDVDPVDS